MPSEPSIRSMPTPDLLALLLGDVAAQACRGKLVSDLLALRPRTAPTEEITPDPRAQRVLDAAKELVVRALAEAMHFGDCLASPAAVRDYLRLRFGDLPHEVFVVLLLDAQNHLIADVELFRGTLTQTSVYPREVVKLALTHNAAAMMFAHNHPSGSPEPSQADIELTGKLRQALALIDVRTLDHFIISASAPAVSLAERGLI